MPASARLDRLHAARYRFFTATAGVAEGTEQYIADRAVHGAGHQLGQQGAGRANHRAGNDHGGIAEHEALEGHGEPGQRVEQGDHHRHVGTADRQGHEDAVGQGQQEKAEDDGGGKISAGQQYPAEGDGGNEYADVEELLARKTGWTVHPALQLGKGNQRTREGDRADQAAEYCQGEEGSGVKLTAQQFHCGDGTGGATAHTVVERDHLRHVGHGNRLAGPEGQSATDGDGDGHQQVVLHAGVKEGNQRGDQHADAGPEDAAARGDRRTHAPQADDKQDGRDEVTDFDNVIHQFLPLLLLNISSMRSVTT